MRLHHTLALLLLAAPGGAQSPPPAHDPRQLEPVDGEPSAALPQGARLLPVAEALRKGELERAEALLVQEAEARPSPEALRLLGGVFLRRGRPLNAAIALKKAEAMAPLDEPGRFTLAMAYVALGRGGWARPELARLAASAPANALYPYWVARLDYDSGQYATAVTGLQRAIELDPGMMKAHDNLGLCYEALGRFDEARRSYEEAIRLNEAQQTRSPWPSLNLGLLLKRLDRAEEAEARFRDSLRLDPRFPQARYELGVVLEKSGRLEAALGELTQAAQLDPSYPEPQYALARLYRRSGDTARAEAALQRFEQLKKERERQQQRPGPGTSPAAGALRSE